MDGERLLIVVLIGVIVLLGTSFRRPPNRCARCRELNREQARFCAQCGTRLASR